MHGHLVSKVIQERLGLGCDRLGSASGTSGPEAAHLIDMAVERGIRFFDTANIYGQGDSERILARALRNHRPRVTIVTKAGQYFPAWMQVAKPFKRALVPWIRRSLTVHGLVSATRTAKLPQNFSHSSLCSSVESSLRRLNTDYVDILLLHSPSPEVIAAGDAMHSLERIRYSGKTRKI